MKSVVAAIACVCALVACNRNSATKPIPSASAASSSAAQPAPAASASAVPFEGEIVMNVKDEAATHVPTSITYDIKGDMIRAVPAAPAHVRTISNLANQSAYSIDDGQKEYMDFDAAKTSSPGAKVVKTGKVEKVAGVDCEDWSIDDGSQKMDVCVAKGVAFFDLAADPKTATEPEWAAALTKEKVFPLRAVAHDKAGKEEYRAEATRLDRKSLDATLFQLPTGFKKGDVSAGIKTASLP
jgi:hypothetical protein